MEHNEIHKCQCNHGRARHSENIAGDKNRRGILCLLSDCPCYNFEAVTEDG